MKAERRRSVRAIKPLFAGFSFSCGTARRWHRGLIRDISDRGLCLAVSAAHPIQQKMRVKIMVPSRPSRRLLLDCGVVKKGPQSGNVRFIRLRFIRLNARDRALLREYIAWILVNERGAP